ncbi:MAG: alpha-2-macroglobulin family protein [Rubripirellula sp.]
MSRLRLGFAALSIVIGISLLYAVSPQEADWQEVNDAINRGRPKTAVEKLAPIITSAMNEKRYDEAVKAIALKIALEGNIQGNKPEEKVTRMQAEIERASEEMKPVMEAILANWYWHYFQQNRWRFVQRTEGAATDNEDFTTWDLTRILSEIDGQFEKALSNSDRLKRIPISQYTDLLEKGTTPDNYRPTLFDFLAHNAIDFYGSGEHAGSRTIDAFDLTAESPIFGPTDDFIKWVPKSTDETSLTLKAINLHQQLLRFHQDDQDRSAFLDDDLGRLRFGFNHAFGEEKNARYKAALRRFLDANPTSVISSRASFQLASVIHGEGKWKEAHQVASEGMNRFTDSIGGAQCFNLIQNIEAKASSVSTERVWNDPQPTIDVSYRNVTKIYFRLVPFKFREIIEKSSQLPEQLSAKERLQLLDQRPVLSWSNDLPATDDFQQRIEELPAPIDVASGSYYLIASHNEEFNDTENQISVSEIWVSKLALVIRNHIGRGEIDGFVLDANSGEPLPGATIKAWKREREFVALPDSTTDEDGMFRFSGNDLGRLVLLASHQGDALASGNYLQARVNTPTKRREQTLLFTDRALYRPGQTIHYKGISMSVDQKVDDYHVIRDRELTLVFFDVNGKEIERQQHRTNDYGSFNGSVTAPRDRLMGRMSLRVIDGMNGQTPVTVEEYKRPKFQVEIDRPKSAAKLNQEVQISGSAVSYTGASINDVKVQWRVVRNVQYPSWWWWRCWWMPPRQVASQEIAHGTSVTNANGKFELRFAAKPDASVLKESEPTFRYTIYADVTDTTGETRSSQRTISVGYTALSASITSADWLTDEAAVALAIRTTTLDGEGQPAACVIRIHEVRQTDQVTRSPMRNAYGKSRAETDPSNPASWPLGEVVREVNFETDAAGNAKIDVELSAGMYRAKLETKDSFGTAVSAELPLQVLSPDATKLNLKLPNLYASPSETVEPGQEYVGLWGTGYDTGRAYIEVIHRGKRIQHYWTRVGTTQTEIKQSVNESMRGGFTVRTTFVRENRSYVQAQRVDVPWTNKQLHLTWEHMVSKLEPGAKETWTAIIRGSDAKNRVAEMVATMYDASLDAYLRHDWPASFGVFRQDYVNTQVLFENQQENLRQFVHSWKVDRRKATLTYRHFPSQIITNWSGYSMLSKGMRMRGQMAMDGAVAAAAQPMMEGVAANTALGVDFDVNFGERDASKTTEPDLSNVPIRKNLNETAFFYPHLISNSEGEVRLKFTMPEALTEWRFLGFAHDPDLSAGLLTGSTVTAKDLMVQPNPPRFLREGDVVEFTVKVSNQSATHQTGTVRLTFADARTDAVVDDKLGNQHPDQPFELAAGESKSYAWKLSVPDNLGFLTYKAVGSTGRLSDGEQGYLPVLSRRILVTESLPLPIRGPETKTFDFKKLLDSGDSKSLQHQSLTVQMTSNPSWYAVMALPYLMEYPHECTEQTFNRLYANLLASHIAAADPKIHRIFDQWRATPALDSPLDKNEELKSLMVEETPWYRQSQSESQARRNVGILFDDNRLSTESTRALQKLVQMQRADGAWPWFPGGPENTFITMYINAGFGRMRHLGVDVDVTPAINSIAYLDRWATGVYTAIKPEDRPQNNLSTSIAFYLYGRSFFLKDQPVADEHRVAFDYWVSQAKTHWLDLANRQSQAHMAVALKRFDHLKSAQAIMTSIKERSVNDEELGMFWRETEMSWWWYRAPIETQAMMIEAFDEVMNDQQAVEDCKVWLLKQKQTQDWKTTKATADAVYALLIRGTDLLASDEIVTVSLGGEPITPKDVEAGTGFYEARVVGSKVYPQMGTITVEKSDRGVAWGGVHWQYMEDMENITPYEGTPLKLEKELYVKKNTDSGPKLQRVAGAVSVGDELVVRIVLRTDRDMEYVHLKDYRGSGTEPVNVLSRYQYQDGLAYYESTRDTASHFFIDYLPKGTYVFEYSTRIQLKGAYQTGVAEIQCMYAPEFNSHSESLVITAD